MAYSWQSDIIRPDGENGTEVLDTNGVYQPQIEGGDNITIEDGKISASGTLENVNADWVETDPNDPSYIEHKPDLSIYATASGMETELAGKQNVISDLETIRSGAASGSTAVQPGDLAAVATTGSYTSLSNTPQNIVQDASYVHTDNNFSNADKSKLDGIAAGAEVNVQPDWNETDSSSDAYIANKPTIPAAQVNSDWNASSGVAQILNKPDLSAYATDTELTDGLATKQDIISDLDTIRAGAAAGATAAQPSDLPSSDELLPSATSGDSGKVLTVDAQGEPSWQTPASVTVDQTYNASSTNAQSGTAVAQAIAAIPSSSYTAGDGIKISNNEISADFTEVQSALDFSSDFTFENPTQYTSTTTSDVRSVVIPTDAATKFTLPGTLDDWPYTTYIVNVKLQVGSGSTWTTLKSGNYYSLESIPTEFYTNVDIPAGLNGKYIRWFCTYSSDFGTETQSLYILNFDTTANCFTVPGTGTLAIANPLPASAQADSGKVLKVNASGNAEWGTDSDTTYTAGNMIAINAGSNNAIGVSTTAGITDIQQVAALPANPVATVLYLIPET